MDPRPSARMQAVQSPIIPIVGAMIREHPGTISLGQGVVSYGPPPEAGRQVARFFEDPDNHKYKAVEGIPALRQRIEQKLRDENGVDVATNASRAVVTAGGNMAFMNAVLAVADAGDEVVLQSPYYFNQEMAVAIAGCKVVTVATDANYQLRLDAIEAAITPRTRAVVTISPNNPSGAVYPEAALRAVNEICRRRGAYHVHDEAYEYFVYGKSRHFSPASIEGAGAHTISLYSLSKAYGFASWRIGWMVIPEHLTTAVMKIQDTVLICPPVVSQFAATGAMEAGAAWRRPHVDALAEVRGIVSGELAQLGDRCTVPPADGAFYFLMRVHTPMPALDLVERLIREHGVAVIPGETFGLHEGCYLRVAYGALRKETVVEGIGRLVRGLRAIVGT